MYIFQAFIFVLLLVFFGLPSYSQELTSLETKELSLVSTFPKEILSSKSVVISNANFPSDELENQLHKKLRSKGVDVVSYYVKEDVFMGDASIYYYALEMRKRGIQNLIILDAIKEGLHYNYKITISKFNRKRSLLNKHQEAFELESGNFEILLDRLGNAIERDPNLTRKNFLIIDQPEYANRKNLFRKKAKIILEYPTDLNYTKLAVDKYNLLPTSSANEKLINFNDNQGLANEQLANLFKTYPYKYDILDYDMKKEKELIKNGYLFVLLKAYGKESKLKKSLGYQKKEGSNSSDNEVKVYKYYFKHLRNGNLFLGTDWKTSTNKVEALKTFLEDFNQGIK